MYHNFEIYSADTPLERFSSAEAIIDFTLSTWAYSFNTYPRPFSSSSKFLQIGSSNRTQGSLDTLQIPIEAANFDASHFRFNSLIKSLSRFLIAYSWLSATKTLNRLMSMFLIHFSEVKCESTYMSSSYSGNNIGC